MQILAGFDLGTTGCRCVLFNDTLDILGESYHEYPLITGENGIVEQDAEHWWTLLIRALKDAAALAGHATDEICALSLSSQGITVVPVDRDFAPLTNAINWLDHRPDTGIEEVLEHLGDERYQQITARLSPVLYGLSKLTWFMRHRPEICSRTYKFLMPMDFIIARLCDNPVTDHTMAAGMGCYDMANRCWSKEILSAANIDIGKLPKIIDSGNIVGYVTTTASKTSGLRVGTPVVIGAQDQKCGAIGAGYNSEYITVSMGTCIAAIFKCNQPVCDVENYLPCFSDPFLNDYLLEACINVGAGCLKWVRDLWYPDRDYSVLIDMAGSYIPSIETPMFFPHLAGMSTPRRWENCSASFYGLTLNTSSNSIIYSVLESIGFSLRQNIEAARKTTGINPNCLRIFGGGAKSEFWLQIISNICGLPVERLFTHEMCCVGAAILAGIGSGIFSSLVDAQYHSIRIDKRYFPDPSISKLINHRYALYNIRENRIYKEAHIELNHI